MAKQRLDRKYGGERRSVALYLEEVDQLKPIRANHVDDIEKLADLMDILVLKLKDTNKAKELGNGLLYIKLQQKIPTIMLSQYYKWVHENREEESVATLRKWIMLESDFLKIAHETTRGFYQKDKPERTYFGQQKPSSTTQLTCVLCKNKHDIQNCDQFNNLAVAQRWEIAKKHRLCYRCLKINHRLFNCQSKVSCNITSCNEKHHSMLHKANSDTEIREDSGTAMLCMHTPTSLQAQGTQTSTFLQSHREDNGTTMLCTQPLTSLQAHSNEIDIVALRTIPVILRNGGYETTINVLLDDGSTKYFLNSGIADALHLPREETTNIFVNVLNGNTETFQTSIVDFEILSADRSACFPMSAYTADNVTADLHAVDWNSYKDKFHHLKDIHLPQPYDARIDLLIGIDQIDLHQAIREIVW